MRPTSVEEKKFFSGSATRQGYAKSVADVFDALFCLGDVATLGPRPTDVLARLKDLRCRNVMGNHDEFMLDPALIRSYSESSLILSSVEATRDALSEGDVAFIRTFERTI